MQEGYSIGIDIGGTNADVVLLNKNQIIAFHKTSTTSNVTDGVVTGIRYLLQTTSIDIRSVHAVMIGTTHFVNSVLQNKGLNQVLSIRLAKPATTAIPPLSGWPEKLKSVIGDLHDVIDGGYEFNGKELSPLDRERLRALAVQAKSKDIRTAAITGIFSHVNVKQEIEARDILRSVNPALQVTLSHEIGGLGLLTRENATILNAAITNQFQAFYRSIRQAFEILNLSSVSLYFSSNDGTLENPAYIFPISTYGSGPSNSMRGAAILSGLKHAIIVDIGGTSTDVGILKDGFPLQSGYEITVGNETEGVICNFASPLIKSAALGGGSIIRVNDNNEITIGPESVAYRLENEARVFGGKTLTLTDIAVSKRRIQLGDTKLMQDADLTTIDKADRLMHEKLAKVILQILPFVQIADPVPLVLVGGGAMLFDNNQLMALLNNKISTIIVPSHSGCANALGAAIAQISGNYNGVFQYTETAECIGTPRAEAIEIAKKKAIDNAIAKGAILSTIKLQELEELPINYLPGNQTRIKVRVVGDLQSFQNVRQPNDKDHQVVVSSSSTALVSQLQVNSAMLPNQSVAQALHSEFTPTSKSNSSAFFQSLDRYEYLLTNTDITDIAVGTGLLGSGGGGETTLGELVSKVALKAGNDIRVLPISKLNDDALVVAVGVMGAPTVLAEKLPSKEESINAITKMEEVLNKKINYVVPLEIGGMNGLYAVYVGSQSKKTIVDADCMGRAFPEIQMVTPNIYGSINNCVAVLANGQESCVLRSDSIRNLEYLARKKTTEMGGIVTLVYMPMDGKAVKSTCVPNSLSASRLIGKGLRESNNANVAQVFNELLRDSQYSPANMIIKGKIIDLQRSFVEGFNVGFAIVEDASGLNAVKIDFQNENLRAINLRTNEVIVLVPNIITLIDNELKPLSCENMRVGLEVSVISLAVPNILLTQKALDVIGPGAFKLQDVHTSSAMLVSGK